MARKKLTRNERIIQRRNEIRPDPVMKDLHVHISNEAWNIISRAKYEDPRARGFACRIIELWASEYQAATTIAEKALAIETAIRKEQEELKKSENNCETSVDN